MTSRDRVLAVVCVTLWGLQFVVTDIALRDAEPFLLVALRFLPVALVTVVFVRPPAVRLRWLLGYGLGLGVVEFALLFLAMDAGLPSGLAALILQSSAPFTVLLGMLLLRQRPGRTAVIGLVLCVSGLSVVAVVQGQRASLGPVLLALGAGLSWAVGNLCAAQARADDPFRFSLWMTTVPPIPMLAAAWWIEGPEATWSTLGLLATGDGWRLWLCVIYLAGLSTAIGTGIWTVLLARYPTHRVAPLSTLVPVIGLTSGAIFLREPLNAGVLAGGAVVLTGLALITRRSGRAPVAPEPGGFLGQAPEAGR